MPIEFINDGLNHRYYEIINGEKFFIPSRSPAHSSVIGRIMMAVGKNLIENECGYFFSNVDVYFDEKNIFVPCVAVILKEHEQILSQRDMIRGVPDMVVEILSYSTRKKDLTIKKDTYEAQGVREYWIIDPWAKIVDVYLLRDGKYFLSEEYMLPDEKDLEFMTDAERAAIKSEIAVSILDGLKVPLSYIFKWGYK